MKRGPRERIRKIEGSGGEAFYKEFSNSEVASLTGNMEERLPKGVGEKRGMGRRGKGREEREEGFFVALLDSLEEVGGEGFFRGGGGGGGRRGRRFFGGFGGGERGFFAGFRGGGGIGRGGTSEGLSLGEATMMTNNMANSTFMCLKKEERRGEREKEKKKKRKKRKKEKNKRGVMLRMRKKLEGLMKHKTNLIKDPPNKFSTKTTPSWFFNRQTNKNMPPSSSLFFPLISRPPNNIPT